MTSQSELPSHLSEIDVVQRIMSRPTQPAPTDEEHREIRRRREAERRSAAEEALLTAVGARYGDCRLDTFVVGADEHADRRRKAVDSCRELAEQLRDHVRAGGNLVIAGPAGTGKDHLLVSQPRTAIAAHGLSVDWQN